MAPVISKPDGLPVTFGMELGQMCVEKNACKFLDRFLCPNCGTATGPPHTCDFADIFIEELDLKIIQLLESSIWRQLDGLSKGMMAGWWQ